MTKRERERRRETEVHQVEDERRVVRLLEKKRHAANTSLSEDT